MFTTKKNYDDGEKNPQLICHNKQKGVETNEATTKIDPQPPNNRKKWFGYQQQHFNPLHVMNIFCFFSFCCRVNG